jgi:hypothetical protein
MVIRNSKCAAESELLSFKPYLIGCEVRTKSGAPDRNPGTLRRVAGVPNLKHRSPSSRVRNAPPPLNLSRQIGIARIYGQAITRKIEAILPR